MVKDVNTLKTDQSESGTREFSVLQFENVESFDQGFWGFTLVPDGDKESSSVVEVGVFFLVSTR